MNSIALFAAIVLPSLLEDPRFLSAQADLLVAPDFCAVAYIRADQTRGYVAVCELVLPEAKP